MPGVKLVLEMPRANFGRTPPSKLKHLIWRRLEIKCANRMMAGRGKVSHQEAAGEAMLVFEDLGYALRKHVRGARAWEALHEAIAHYGFVYSHEKLFAATGTRGKKMVSRSFAESLRKIKIANLEHAIHSLEAVGRVEGREKVRKSIEGLRQRLDGLRQPLPEHAKQVGVSLDQLTALRSQTQKQRLEGRVPRHLLEVFKHVRDKVGKELFQPEEEGTIRHTIDSLRRGAQ